MKIQNAIIITTDTPIEMTIEEMERDMKGCFVFSHDALPPELR